MSRSYAANFTRLATTEAATATGLTFVFANTDNAPAVPFYAVLSPQDENNREIVKFSTKTATTLVCDSLADRYLDGSAQPSGIVHGIGTEVLLAPLAQHLDDLWDQIEGLALGDLTDVDTSGAATGQVLTYDGSEWAPQTPETPSPIPLILALGG